jgi:CheY-like chemotaxis protein
MAETGLGPTATRLHALIVSNDPATVEQLTESLRQLATFTEVCTDVPNALRLLNHRKYEAVVLDLDIGAEAGEVIQSVRVSSSNRTTVTFSVASSKEQGQIAFDAGSSFVLQKPLSVESISRTLNAAYGLIVRERRRYFRCPVRTPVRIREEGTLEDTDGQSVNISEDGMAVATTIHLRRGAQVGVRFTIPDEATEFTPQSVIRWDHQGSAGLQFITFPPNQKSSLQQWLGYKLEEKLPESVTYRFRKKP